MTDKTYPVVYAAKASRSVRQQSSSGGAFTSLYEAALKQGGVVYGSAFDDSLRAVHIRCTTAEECERCRGSKYSQSDMGDCFSEALNDLHEGRLVLFTGTPCQIAGIKKLTGNPSSLITAEIICHGTPSPMLFKQYLEFIQNVRNQKVIGYEHRPKNEGWRHSERAFFENSEECDTRLLETWKRLFYSNLFLRPSCARCPFAKMPREADITIGDYWGISDTDVASFSDNLGVSLILVNSEKGSQFFDNVTIDSKSSTFADALTKNPNLIGPSKVTGDRKAAWSYYRSHGFSELVKHYRFYRSLPRWIAGRAKYHLSQALKP